MIDIGTESFGADVVPIHILGVTNVDLTWTSSLDLMSFALANLSDSSKEGGYVIRHSRHALDDFGETVAHAGGCNPLAAAFPVLFPYSVGSIEALRTIKVSVKAHTQWALQYHDRWFATHHSFAFVLFGILQKRAAM